MKTFKMLVAAAAAMLALAACQKPETVVPLELPEGVDKAIEIGPEGGTLSIKFQGSKEITATSDKPNWCEVDVTGHTVILTVKMNNSQSSRKANVTVSDEEDVVILNLTQKAGTFLFEPAESYELPFEKGGSVEIACNSAFEMEINSSATWCTVNYVQDENKVVVSATPASKTREATVTYAAGPYTGEFTVKQVEKVDATLMLELKESGANTKQNAVYFILKGKKIASAAIVLTSSKYFESNGVEYYEELLKTDEDFSFDASGISKINSEAGYTGGFVNLTPGTEYVVIAYLVNTGNAEAVLVESITTEESEDPILIDYEIGDLLTLGDVSNYVGKWDVYFKGLTGDQSQRYSVRNKFGEVEITNAGLCKSEDEGGFGEYSDSLRVSGLVRALTMGAADVDMNLMIYRKTAGARGIIYFDSPFVYYSKGEADKFYELYVQAGYEGADKYQYPAYPLMAGETNSGCLAFVDGGYGDYIGAGELDHLRFISFVYPAAFTEANIAAAEEGTLSPTTSEVNSYVWDLLLVRPTVGNVKAGAKVKDAGFKNAYKVSKNAFQAASKVAPANCVEKFNSKLVAMPCVEKVR